MTLTEARELGLFGSVPDYRKEEGKEAKRAFHKALAMMWERYCDGLLSFPEYHNVIGELYAEYRKGE